MHSNGHVRFGGRAGETGREQSRYCAPARPYFRIQRRTKQGTSKKYVYTYPSKKALAAIKDKVRAITGKSDRALALLLRHLNLVLRGWCNYFRHGVSAATFQYLDYFVWCRVTRWLRKRHPQAN